MSPHGPEVSVDARGDWKLAIVDDGSGLRQTLLVIHPDGTVEADSLEAASQAGRAFVQAIRGGVERDRILRERAATASTLADLEPDDLLAVIYRLRDDLDHATAWRASAERQRDAGKAAVDHLVEELGELREAITTIIATHNPRAAVRGIDQLLNR